MADKTDRFAFLDDDSDENEANETMIFSTGTNNSLYADRSDVMSIQNQSSLFPKKDNKDNYFHDIVKKNQRLENELSSRDKELMMMKKQLEDYKKKVSNYLGNQTNEFTKKVYAQHLVNYKHKITQKIIQDQINNERNKYDILLQKEEENHKNRINEFKVCFDKKVEQIKTDGKNNFKKMFN